MSPAEWNDLPDWEHDLLIRGLWDEFGGDGERPAEGGERPAEGAGDGSLNEPPAELLRHLGR